MKRLLFLISMIFNMNGFVYATNPQKPIMSRLYNDPYSPANQTYNSPGALGTLNDEFGTDGSLNLRPQIDNAFATARAVCTLPNGLVFVALDRAGVVSKVAQYTATGVVTSFGSSGVCSLSPNYGALAMIIDGDDRIVVCGTGPAGWVKRVSSAGILDTTFNTNFANAGSWTAIGAIAQQSNGRYLVAGNNGTYDQVAAFSQEGLLDNSFATDGYFVFDGLSGRPQSTAGLFNLAIDDSDNVYVGYSDYTTGYANLLKLNPLGTPDASFGTGGIISNILAGAVSANYIYTALIPNGFGILVGGTLTSTGVTSVVGYSLSGGPALFTTSAIPSSGSDVVQIAGLVSLTNSYFAVISSNTTAFTMRIDQFDASGNPDTTFNADDTPGYIEFNPAATGISSAYLYGGAISPDGQLYVAGSQASTTPSGVVPYLSKLYDYAYVTQVPSFPATNQQGDFDTSFGSLDTESFAGVPFLYNGNFGLDLQQKARVIQEISSGDLLVGSDGYTDSAGPLQTMMLTWLDSDGIYDPYYGSNGSIGYQSGKLILTNTTAAHEQLAAFAVGNSGTVYVAGTSGATAPFLRAYTSVSTTNLSVPWSIGTAAWNASDTGSQAVGLALQGSTGELLFVANAGGATGHISRYTTAGALDTTTFGTDGSIATGNLGLNMGPVYGGGLVDAAGNIIIAYKLTTADQINIAMINKNGTALITEFGPAGTGVISNVFFDGVATGEGITSSNVRIAFDQYYNVYVAAVNADGTNYIIRRYRSTGAIDLDFYGGNILTIPYTGTALSLTNLTGLSDGSVMLTGYDVATDPVMLTARVTGAGIVDATFNSQGSVPGVLPIQIQDTVTDFNARVATGLAIQSSTGNIGNIVLSAYEQPISSQSTPEMIRIYGKSGTTQVQRFPSEDQAPGTLDIALNDSGALNLEPSTLLTGVATVVYVYPDGNDYEGKILIGIDTGSSVNIMRVDATSLAYDTSFNSEGDIPGLYTIEGLTGFESMTVDADNRIIICGTSSSAWARQIPKNGQNTGTQVLTSFAMPSSITAAHMIYQQKSGRYIIAGSNSGTSGVLIAFQDEVVAPATQLAVDETFNPLASGSIAGQWDIDDVTSLYNLVINADDSIYVAYKSIDTGFLIIAQILANGSGLDTAFGSSTGILTTPINSFTNSGICLGVDANQNVIVGASGTGTNLQIFRCDLHGGTTTQFTGFGVASGVLTIAAPALGTAGVTLKALLETETQQTILIGSNSSGVSTGVDGNIFAVRLTSTGPVDTSWNPDAVSPAVPGILTFGATTLSSPITTMSNAAIQVNGNIFAVGGTSTDPVLMEIVGDSYVNEVAQGQLAAPAGTLDYTLDVTGALDLNDDTGLTLGNVEKLYIYPDGSMLMASIVGVTPTAVITKLDATLAVDTDFGTDGQVTVSSGVATINDLFVANGTDQSGYIYLTGATTGTEMWAAQITAHGVMVTALPALSGWTLGAVIRENVAGNIIVAGFNGANGAIASFTADGLGLDPLFGVNGIYVTDRTNPISAMTIDNYSEIYIAYKSGESSGTIQRILANGSGLDSTFTASTFNSCNESQIAIALDISNNQIVVASYYESDISVQRYSTIDGSSTDGGAINIFASLDTLHLSALFIDTDQQIYVVGYGINGAYQTVVARIASTSDVTIALDNDYGTAGIAALVAGPLTDLGFFIGSGALNPDRRVYVVGSIADGTPYMARLFGDNYYTQISQALNAVSPGDFDYTYGTNGIAITYADGATGSSANQQVKAINQLPFGTQIMTVVGDGIHSWTVRLLSDGANDSAYGSGQGVAIAQLAGDELVQGMVYDGQGNSIVFGSNSLEGGYVKSILPSGSMNIEFGGYTGSFSTTTYPLGTAYIPQVDIVNSVAQLSNGNFIFVGSKNDVGIIGMLSLTGSVIPFGSAVSGLCSVGVNCTSVSIDTDDYIYVSAGYLSEDTLKDVQVIKLNSSGQLVINFGSDGVVESVLVDSDDYGHNRLVFNDAGKIIVAASGNNESQGTIQVIQLLANGLVDPGFNSGHPCVINFDDNTHAIITSLVVLTNNNILISGYQDGGDLVTNNDYEFVACVTTDGVLDTTFNPYGTTPGLLTFQVATDTQQARYVWAMNVQVDGQILVAGSETPSSAHSTPLTMRLDGYENTQSVPQFDGYKTSAQTDSQLNLFYGQDGIATAEGIEGLQGTGDIVIDSQGRAIIAGYTSVHTFVVARFTTAGILDTTFGLDGIVESAAIDGNLASSFIDVTSTDDIIIGGILTVDADVTFVVNKFLGTDGSQVTSGFGTSGLAQTPIITNLTTGGYVNVDVSGKILIGGYTSDFQLVVARFNADGTLDSDGFNHAGAGGMPAGIATTGMILYLSNGGYVVTDADHNVYLGGSSLSGTLLVAKISSTGSLVTGFATSGIAQTGEINNFVTGGSVALNSSEEIFVGGYTSNQTFVVAKFLTTGLYDPSFSSDGIALSNPVGMTISSYGDIGIDSNDSIIIGGTAILSTTIPMTVASYSRKMFAARWLATGAIDTTFSTTGIAYTGTLDNVIMGGFVGSDIFDHVFVAGVISHTIASMTPPEGSCIVAQFYSGQEIFVTDPSTLSPSNYKIYYYGNNPELFIKYFGIDVFAQSITDISVQSDTIIAVQAIFANYAEIYQDQPGWNLVWHSYRIYSDLIAAQAILRADYLSSETQINQFFDLLYTRIGILTGHYLLVG